MDNPRIVIALIVENAGFGGTAAAPIARKAMDYFLLGKKSSPTPVVPAVTDSAEYPDMPDEDVQPMITPAIPDEDSTDEE